MTDYKRPNSDNYFEIQAELGLPFLGKELDNELTDAKNQRIALKQDIDATAAGNIPGSAEGDNENKVLITDGQGNLSWVLAGEHQIANGGVTTDKYRDRSITNDKYQDTSISTSKYRDLSVTTEKINHNAVTTEKINHNAVTTEKIAEGNVTTAKIEAGAVTANELAVNAVTYEKLGNNVVLELMKAMYPIGAVYITYIANQAPPLQNAGITWTAIAAGRAVETASLQNNGQTVGTQPLYGGYTESHALTVDEIPPHEHDYTFKLQTLDAFTQPGNSRWHGTKQQKTGKTGGGEGHRHVLRIANQKLLFWRRTA